MMLEASLRAHAGVHVFRAHVFVLLVIILVEVYARLVAFFPRFANESVFACSEVVFLFLLLAVRVFVLPEANGPSKLVVFIVRLLELELD